VIPLQYNVEIVPDSVVHRFPVVDQTAVRQYKHVIRLRQWQTIAVAQCLFRDYQDERLANRVKKVPFFADSFSSSFAFEI
jgi:hypothetical protein